MARNIEKLITEGNKVKEMGGKITYLNAIEFKELTDLEAGKMEACTLAFLAGLALGAKAERVKGANV